MNEIQSGHITYYIEEIQARRNYCAAQVGPTTFQCVAWFQSSSCDENETHSAMRLRKRGAVNGRLEPQYSKSSTSAAESK
jgi:hypothetical protein